MTKAILLAALAGVGLIGFVACIRRPARTAIPLFAATLPIGSAVTLHVPLPDKFDTLSSALGAITIVACVAHVVLYRRGRVPSMPVAGWLLFIAWSTLSLFWSIDLHGSLQTLTVAGSLILLLLAVSILPTDETDLDVLRVALIVSGILVGLYALSLIARGQPLPAHGASQRLSITTSDTDPNILAASLLLPMLLSVERILVGGTRWWSTGTWRALGTAGVFFSFVAIVFTASRGGLLSAAFGFVVCLASTYRLPAARRMVRRVGTAVAALALGVSAVLLIAPPRSNPALEGVLGNASLTRITNPGSTGSGRTDIWLAGYRACLSYCGWGAGLGAFPDAYNQVFALSGAENNIGLNRPAHDIYLQAAVEEGFVGLGFLLLALVLEWRALGTTYMRRALPSGKAALAAVLLANVFLSAMFFKYFWLLFVVFRVADGAEESTTSPAPRGPTLSSNGRAVSDPRGLVASPAS